MVGIDFESDREAMMRLLFASSFHLEEPHIVIAIRGLLLLQRLLLLMKETRK